MSSLNPSEPLSYHHYSPEMKIAMMEIAIERLQEQRGRLPLSYKSRRSSCRVEMGTRLLIAEMLIANKDLSRAESHIKKVESMIPFVEDSEVSSRKCFLLLERIKDIRGRVILLDESPSLEE